jgi:hypothetical protein
MLTPAGLRAQEPPKVPPVNMHAGASTPHEERHPTIRRAIAHLERTRSMLQNDAAHDFHGHREAAIHHIDEAIHELHEAIESDRD